MYTYIRAKAITNLVDVVHSYIYVAALMVMVMAIVVAVVVDVVVA